MNKTRIEWCDSTWNPVTGCLHGCEYCYARKIANRFGKVDPLIADEFKNVEKVQCFVKPDNPYPYLFKPTFHRYRLDEPSKKMKGQNIFVCSMADLFGEWVLDEWIKEIFEACEKAPQHNYLFLTKNPKRYGQINGWNHIYDWSFAKKNWWFGLTVTNTDNLNLLKSLPYGSTNTFVSFEPLQNNIDLSYYLPNANTKYKCSYCGHLTNHYSAHCQHCNKEGGYCGSFRKNPINWVIIGAETGNRKGKVIPKKEWIDNIVKQCKIHDIPVLMKESLVPIIGEENMLREFPKGLMMEMSI